MRGLSHPGIVAVFDLLAVFAAQGATIRGLADADHRDAYHLSNLYEAALYSMVEAAGSVSVAHCGSCHGIHDILIESLEAERA